MPPQPRLIAVGSTPPDRLKLVADQDWFKFQAVAGKNTSSLPTLAGLTDSVLTLYAGNGTTQLAYNDDIASNNPASQHPVDRAHQRNLLHQNHGLRYPPNRRI